LFKTDCFDLLLGHLDSFFFFSFFSTFFVLAQKIRVPFLRSLDGSYELLLICH
jgi:hypothetical protein